MISNDVFRRLRYALDLDDRAMQALFALADEPLTLGELASYLKKEEDPGFAPMDEAVLERFLDALIVQKRGARPGAPAPVQKPYATLTNNAILKKLRVALQLRDEDVLAVMALAKVQISKSELAALFRNEDHRNYKPCGDQFLRQFLSGLPLYIRRGSATPSSR